MQSPPHAPQPPIIPKPDVPAVRLVGPFVRFMHIEGSSGIVLLASTLVALAASNSAWAEDYARFWEAPFAIVLGDFELRHSLSHWINDGLMTIFFFVVGLEIKREMVAGELRDIKKAILPIAAAAGGMIVPAAIYLSLRWNLPGEQGWGIAMATDIAFVIGFLALLGSRVPAGLKVFLLALAIVDDLGAVLVIALFYTEQISWIALALAAAGFAIIFLLQRLGVRRVPIYFVVGSAIWLAFLESGIHPTVAGVMLGLLTPASAWIGDQSVYDVLARMVRWIQRSDDGVLHGNRKVVNRLITTVRESVSPLERLERSLHPWVAFVIMPIFALANAGVSLRAEALIDPIAAAVVAGLVIGKPVGIVFFSLLALAVRLGKLPEGVTLRLLIGGGCLAGIGFTMSLFVAGLALDESHLDAGKVGTLLGSTISAVIGCVWLLMVPRNRPTEPSPQSPRELAEAAT